MYLNSQPYFIGRRAFTLVVLIADGSVQFLSESLDAASLRALVTRSGGEVVTSF